MGRQRDLNDRVKFLSNTYITSLNKIVNQVCIVGGLNVDKDFSKGTRYLSQLLVMMIHC